MGGSIMRRLEMKRPTRLVITSSPFREDLISPERGYAQPEEPDIDDQYDSREYEEVGYVSWNTPISLSTYMAAKGKTNRDPSCCALRTSLTLADMITLRLHRSDR
ncbi:MAG: hypothetical protein RQM90_09445 [Methanoculleus sp.]